MFKNAEGLSLNVIIMAILALIVLVVVAMIFGWKMGWSITSLTDCSNNGGTCYDGTKCISTAGGTKEMSPLGGSACFIPGSKEKSGKICCPPGAVGQ
ncbi:MAG: hypothetical protein V1702_03140 [Candidatus Woesearchaeota archaeon]